MADSRQASNAGDSALLLQYLEKTDASCPACGYNLRGLKTAVCPECHAPLTLTVASAQAHPGPWIFAMVALAMGLGFDTVVTCLLGTMFIVRLIVDTSIAPAEVFQTAAVIGLFIAAALACALLIRMIFIRRRTWAMKSRKRQWRWTAFSFAGTFIAHLGVAAIIFTIFN